MERLIHILPEQVASQIAAGEVVERPASALKELVENSLDAGAKAVSIEIERGGAGLIAVSDDGCGMGREDAILSLRRHATSKIRDAADLTAIRTMGFRGEALASIASVAQLRMLTRRAADLAGIEIVAAGGEISLTRECAAAPGTRIEVRDLFFNTPARLKFLKTLATEQAAAAEVIARLGIARARPQPWSGCASFTARRSPRGCCRWIPSAPARGSSALPRSARTPIRLRGWCLLSSTAARCAIASYSERSRRPTTRSSRAGAIPPSPFSSRCAPKTLT
jgi:hypothetical protein